MSGYGDLCGLVWSGSDQQLTAHGGDALPVVPVHMCKRLERHEGEHVCSCGARS